MHFSIAHSMRSNLKMASSKSEIEWRSRGHFFAKFELDPAVRDGYDASAADHGVGGDIEFLANAGAQNADQVIGVVAGEGGAVARDFVGDPSAAGHEAKRHR